jgi:hypothetical protein
MPSHSIAFRSSSPSFFHQHLDFSNRLYTTMSLLKCCSPCTFHFLEMLQYSVTTTKPLIKVAWSSPSFCCFCCLRPKSPLSTLFSRCCRPVPSPYHASSLTHTSVLRFLGRRQEHNKNLNWKAASTPMIWSSYSCHSHICHVSKNLSCLGLWEPSMGTSNRIPKPVPKQQLDKQNYRGNQQL